jgi:outer membrane protein OmpA-like peptidoglycan-associated protein
MAVRSGGKISIENMGLPYNSAMDDFGYGEDEDGNQFFTSNREGGVGNDDIYFYKAPPKPEDDTQMAGNDPKNPNSDENNNKDQKIINYNLNVLVAKSANNQKTPLDSALIKIFKIESGLEEIIEEHVFNSTSPKTIKLEEDTDYIILAEKEGFLTKREGFTMYGRSVPQALLKKPVTDTTFTTEITLEQIFIGKTFRLENIYYDLDKYDIRPDAALELDKLVQILKDNPLIKIELGSHTDVRGSDVYNIRLSQRRAEAVINYLAIKGTSKERLTAKGYGETELIIANAKNEEEHQVNRRTEFKVTDFIKSDTE